MNMQVLEAPRDVRGGYKVDVSRGQRIGRVSSEWFSRPDDERFLSLGDLARTYMDPYIDRTGQVTAYGSVDLRVLGGYNWRLASHHVWKVERLLYEIPHRPLPSSKARVAALRRKYVAYLDAHNGHKPIYYDRSTWTPIPKAFLKSHG